MHFTNLRVLSNDFVLKSNGLGVLAQICATCLHITLLDSIRVILDYGLDHLSILSQIVDCHCLLRSVQSLSHLLSFRQYRLLTSL